MNYRVTAIFLKPPDQAPHIPIDRGEYELRFT